MKIVVVSNYLTELDSICKAINAVYPKWEITRFTDPFITVRYVEQNLTDIVLVAARLRPPTGIELLRVIKRSKPKLPVIIFADSDEYCSVATKAGANDYLVLPLTTEEIQRLEKTMINNTVNNKTNKK